MSNKRKQCSKMACHSDFNFSTTLMQKAKSCIVSEHQLVSIWNKNKILPNQNQLCHAFVKSVL